MLLERGESPGVIKAHVNLMRAPGRAPRVAATHVLLDLVNSEPSGAPVGYGDSS